MNMLLFLHMVPLLHFLINHRMSFFIGYICVSRIFIKVANNSLTVTRRPIEIASKETIVAERWFPLS